MMLSLVFTACQTEENKETTNSELDTIFQFKELTNSFIGTEENGKIKLKVSNHRIIATFNDFNLTLGLNLIATSFDIINEDGNNFIRFYSSKNQVSTLALLKDSNNNYLTGKTICKSTACASGGGCIPDGNYCTPCVRPSNGLPGDCERITIESED